MRYWNQDNYQGLKEIGESYSARDGFRGFAGYCLFKEQGLKAQALEALGAFIEACGRRPPEQQREIADELCALGYFNGHVHQLIAHPLQEYLLQVLEGWAAEEPTNAPAHRWLGVLSGNTACFRRAIAVAPDDQISIYRLGVACLNELDFQTHHLGESKLLGELDDAKCALDEASRHIGMLEAQERKDHLERQLEYYQRVVAAWEDYATRERDMTFPDWCRSSGEDFAFSSTFYYGEKPSRG